MKKYGFSNLHTRKLNNNIQLYEKNIQLEMHQPLTKFSELEMAPNVDHSFPVQEMCLGLCPDTLTKTNNF